MSKLNVLVCGSTGYIGIELVKILARHKKISIKYLCGNSSVGKNISFYDKSLSKKKESEKSKPLIIFGTIVSLSSIFLLLYTINNKFG